MEMNNKYLNYVPYNITFDEGYMLYGYDSNYPSTPYLLINTFNGKMLRGDLVDLTPNLLDMNDLTNEIVVSGYNNNEPFTPLLELLSIKGESSLLSYAKDITYLAHNEVYIEYSYYDGGYGSCISEIYLTDNVRELLSQWHFNFKNI